MKKVILFCLCSCCFLAVSAQEEISKYLFPQFEYAKILYKNGATAKAFVNYDLSIDKFVFVDTADSLVKELGEIYLVGAIRTTERAFRVEKHKMQEVLLDNPLLVVEYKAKKKDRGKVGAYGARSQAAAIDNDIIVNSNTTLERKDNDQWVIDGYDMAYQVEREKKMKRFLTFKQFLKIYPRENRDAINAFIEENSVDLRSTEQVVSLCRFAASLE